jgi:hypothetical protein
MGAGEDGCEYFLAFLVTSGASLAASAFEARSKYLSTADPIALLRWLYLQLNLPQSTIAVSSNDGLSSALSLALLQACE